MGLNNCLRCVKYSAVILNALIAVVGIGLAIFASIVRFDNYAEDYVSNLLGHYRTDIKIEMVYLVLYAFVAVGTLSVLVATLGIVGASMEAARALIVFAVLLAVMILAKGACAVGVYISKDQVKCAIQRSLINEIKTFVGSTSADYEKGKKLLGAMQIELKCCGCYNVTDYDRAFTNWMNDSVIELPDGCGVGEYQGTGCCQIIWDQFLLMTLLIGYAALAFIILELLSLMFALILAPAILRSRKQNASKESDKGEDEVDGNGNGDRSWVLPNVKPREPATSEKVAMTARKELMTHSLFSKSDGPILAYVPEARTHL